MNRGNQMMMTMILALAVFTATALVTLVVVAGYARLYPPEVIPESDITWEQFHGTPVTPNPSQTTVAMPITPSAQPPQIFDSVPAFTLTERSGDEVNLQTLSGKVWVAAFVFTECRGTCPAMMARMVQLQNELTRVPGYEDVRIVAVSVDPETDTPEVLRKHAEIIKADPDRWLWLTGRKDPIWSLANDGFKLGVTMDPDNPDMPIAHSTRFVLVDQTGRIRGYYEGLEDAGRAKLLADIAYLLQVRQP